ncbi:hypothetical protein TNCV_649871 [Trichonephila clavipes]|nr:hypothetical protein TNCV_649871 [Trichonephila clavipes]
MERFTNTELADIHLIYEFLKGNARSAERLYHEKYPLRDALDHLMFANLHRNLCEYGSLRGNRHSWGWPRISTDHGIRHISFYAWNEKCWIPFEGILVPCWEIESLMANKPTDECARKR